MYFLYLSNLTSIHVISCREPNQLYILSLYLQSTMTDGRTTEEADVVATEGGGATRGTAEEEGDTEEEAVVTEGEEEEEEGDIEAEVREVGVATEGGGATRNTTEEEGDTEEEEGEDIEAEVNTLLYSICLRERNYIIVSGNMFIPLNVESRSQSCDVRGLSIKFVDSANKTHIMYHRLMKFCINKYQLSSTTHTQYDSLFLNID